MNTSHQNSYKLLNLPRTADWPQAKTQYRRLVQSCHPDKFDSRGMESSRAHEKFLEVNKAFKVLENFYRENQKLPFEPETLSDTDFTDLHQKQKKHSEIKNTSRKRNRKKASKGTAGKLSFALGLAMIIFLLFNSSRESTGTMSIEGDILVDDVLPSTSSTGSSNWNTQLGGDLGRGRVLGAPQKSFGNGLHHNLFERQR